MRCCKVKRKAASVWKFSLKWYNLSIYSRNYNHLFQLEAIIYNANKMTKVMFSFYFFDDLFEDDWPFLDVFLFLFVLADFFCLVFLETRLVDVRLDEFVLLRLSLSLGLEDAFLTGDLLLDVDGRLEFLLGFEFSNFFFTELPLETPLATGGLFWLRRYLATHTMHKATIAGTIMSITKKMIPTTKRDELLLAVAK